MGIDKEWEADLVIMDSISKENNGYKYILTVIDVLSKYAWVEPLKTKSRENLVKAFEKILKRVGNLRSYILIRGLSLPTNSFNHF